MRNVENIKLALLWFWVLGAFVLYLYQFKPFATAILKILGL